MTPASGFLHQLQIAGGTEFAAEIAGIAGVNVDYIRGPQGKCAFQLHPVMDINSGNLLCFHSFGSFRNNAVLYPQ